MQIPDNQADLEDWLIRFQPKGSGPLGEMRIISALLKEVAALRGYDINYDKLFNTTTKFNKQLGSYPSSRV